MHERRGRSTTFRQVMRVAVFVAVVVCLGGGTTRAVEGTRLLQAHAEHDNWLTYGHGYANQRYSGLEQITTDNVHRLVPKWIYQTGVLGTFPTNPLVADGTLYLTTPYNHVVALDAASGVERWRYTHEMSVDRLCCGTHNRGLALGYGRLYMITADARLVALDADTGDRVWDMPVVDPTTGNPADLTALRAIKATDAAQPENAATLTALTRFAGNIAPVVYDDKVFVGVSGTGSIYSSPSIDPELGLIYFGTGNASPGYDDYKRPGDNLYANFQNSGAIFLQNSGATPKKSKKIKEISCSFR